MISRIFIIFVITTSANCLNYDRVHRHDKSKTVDYRVSLRQILRLPEVNRPPFNLFKSREEFVELAEQNIKNYKPYNYKLYRPYNPSKPAFIYDRDYVTKVLSSLGLLRPLQNVPANPRNTSQPVFPSTENFNIKVNSFTESPKPNGRETTTTGNSNEDINTTTNSFSEQTTDAAVSITEDAERTTEITTKSFEFSTYTTEGNNLPNYSTKELVTESNRIETTTNSNTEENIRITTDSYTTLTPNTEYSSTLDERTIVQYSTDSFGIVNTTDILSYSSTEPVTNAETQYATGISTTERIEQETENVLFTSLNRVETTTTSYTQDDFNPTTPDVAAFITQFGHVPTSTAEDAGRTTELTTESFGFSTYTTEGTNIPYYSTTESVTESNRINQTTTDGYTEEKVFTTTDSYTTRTPNAEDSSIVYEETIVQSSTDSFGLANTTDILSYFSTEPTSSAETQYTTEISTTDCMEPENGNLVFTNSNRVETTATSKTEEDVDPTSTDATAPVTHFGNSGDAERTTELTTESFGFSTNAADVANIPDYSTTESVTESNRINQTTTHAYTEEAIFTTTNSYTILTPIAEASLTVDEETIVQSSTESVGIATTADILSNSSTETATSAETVYTNEISTTDCMELENVNLVFTNSNHVETTITSNTIEYVSPTTDSYIERVADAAAFKTTTDNFPTLNALVVEKATELTTPSFWTTINRVDGTDLLHYFTKEPVTSPETTTLSLEPDNASFMFTESNQIETATATNTEQSIPTTTDSFTERTVGTSTTLTPNLTEKPITELAMESWDIERTTETDILKYSTPEDVTFTSTVNPNDTMISTIESLTTETNRMETNTTANENNDIHTTKSNYEDQTNANPTKTAYETENYTTFGVVDMESTALGFDIESTSQICEETNETEIFPETIVPSETVTAEQFENVTFTTEATETSIEQTMELNEIITVNILNGNTTEQESIMFSTTDNFDLDDSIGTTTQISKEIESLADLLQPATKSLNEVSKQAFDSTSIKDITESTTNVVLDVWKMSTTPLLEDITTEIYEVSSSSALMDNSFTSNALISKITELPTLSTTEDNDDITTETSQIECSTEIIEQVEETTIEADAIGETFEERASEISDIETATERSLKNIVENDKGNAMARFLLTDDRTASETYNEIVPETFEQSTNQFTTTSFQGSKTEVMDANTTEFYKENITKQSDSTTLISLVDNSTTASPIVTTELLINIKSNTESHEENSVTSSNHLDNPSIEPLYNRQQNLTIKNLNKGSSKRKAKKFHYDTDVMPSLGDYDYI